VKKLLTHAVTFARIETALKPFADQISPLIIDDQGQMSHPWGESEADGAIVFGNTDAFFGPAAREFFKTVLTLEKLDWFQSSAAGLEHPMLQAIGGKADVYTSSHQQSEAIAEWVLWAGFDYFQRGVERRKAQAEAQWIRLPFREISSTHWLILGFGGIGQAVGRRIRALGGTVTGVRRSGGEDPGANEIISINEVPSYLTRADVVLLCLPHTPDTENIAGADFFAAMKPETLFINVGRGALVDETALLAGLDAGRPAHAALDVFQVEPQPADGAFWHRNDVTMTAHMSATTAQARARTDTVFLDNLALFLAGREMKNTVPASEFS